MSDFEISPAPISQEQAIEPSEQGNNHATEPNIRANSIHDTARKLDPPVAQTTCGSHPIGGDGWIELRVWAEMLYDAQLARISCGNRVERGGIDPAYFRPQLASIAATEHEIELSLRECYRRIVPISIRRWQKATTGIGAHALARFLGHLGDPRTRTIRQLWSYCGHGDATRVRRKGMTQEEALALGNPKCKALLHQILTLSCIRFIGGEVQIGEKVVTRPRSPYRDVYDDRRVMTAGREDWTLLHQHNDALRITGKEILRDLWISSREGIV